MNIKSILTLIIGMGLGFAAHYFTATADADTTEVKYLNSERHLKTGLPFSEAVQVGNVIYLSGQIGIKPGAKALVPGGIGPETRQTLENIRATLQANGSDLDQVFKCTVFLARMGDWPAMNKVYTEMFGQHRPTRSAVGVSGIAYDGSLEMECIASAK